MRSSVAADHSLTFEDLPVVIRRYTRCSASGVHVMVPMCVGTTDVAPF